MWRLAISYGLIKFSFFLSPSRVDRDGLNRLSNRFQFHNHVDTGVIGINELYPRMVILFGKLLYFSETILIHIQFVRNWDFLFRFIEPTSSPRSLFLSFYTNWWLLLCLPSQNMNESNEWICRQIVFLEYILHILSARNLIIGWILIWRIYLLKFVDWIWFAR